MALSRPTAFRGAAHLVTWLPFIYGAASSVWNGWRPVSDTAGIALRSWDVIYRNGPEVGQATRLARGVYDLGPLQYWLETVPSISTRCTACSGGARCGAWSRARSRSRRRG